ncbi:MAG: hypothetical protein A2X73_14160 [Burkholderiales bacterium GWE1_65_30]|nr:MAG: hypothetical protein A2X73_14160 [Burkholderiales bacterium GWE1_65_30]
MKQFQIWFVFTHFNILLIIELFVVILWGNKNRTQCKQLLGAVISIFTFATLMSLALHPMYGYMM